jgi:endonuclease/exonuclease/phosphatase family metal-dependent hydrolase
MEVRKIVEGMTAVEVAEVIDSNFKGLDEEKANKKETDAKFSELESKLDNIEENGPVEIVNNLTEGGTNAALSAEMGKRLNEELSKLGTITEEVVSNEDFVLNNGYLAATSVGQKATIKSDSYLRYSNPVAVFKGDVVEVESQGTGIACIATTDANGSTYTAKAISDNSSSIVIYTYQVEEDGYIAISSRAAALKGKVLRIVGKDRLGDLEKKVSDIDDTIYKEITVSTTDVTEFYEQTDGQTYGSIGSKIMVGLTSTWKHIKINKTDGVKNVSIQVPPKSDPSSVIQYVDADDIIVSLVGTGLGGGSIYKHELSFPEGATSVYVSGTEGSINVDGNPHSIKEKVNIIGDAENLNTDSKVIVDSINEILSVYPTIERENLISNYAISSGQMYGTVGNKIQLSSSVKWSHIKIQNTDGISLVTVSTLADSNNVSSLVQYVDDNDVIVELAVVSPSTGVVYEHKLSFPVGATAAYVSSLMDNLGAYKLKKVTAPSSGNSSFRLRVLSWNIGHYAKGNSGSSGITSDTYEQQKKEFRKVFNKYGADIVGLCEFSSIFFNGETATDAILPQYLYPYIAPTESGYTGTALYSNIKMSNLSEYSVGDKKAYEGHIRMGGKDVIVCMCHLPWSSNEANVSAINTMIERYAEHPYVIIMGDFNYNTGHEEADNKLFTDAGYQTANWGYLGKILTSYNNQIASNYLDNVVVKGGSIVHTEVLQNTPDGINPNDEPILSDEEKWDAVNLSDHFPIICDIVF